VLIDSPQRTLLDIEVNQEHPVWVGSVLHLCSRNSDGNVYQIFNNDTKKYINIAPSECILYEKRNKTYKKYKDMKFGDKELIQSDISGNPPFLIEKTIANSSFGYDDYIVIRPVYGDE
jgi:hypothetical protein